VFSEQLGRPQLNIRLRDHVVIHHRDNPVDGLRQGAATTDQHSEQRWDRGQGTRVITAANA
jgi:hypothetical protein